MIKKNSILLVDDNEILLSLIHLDLKSKGYQVKCAKSGEEALKKIDILYAPEVIITDIIMPQIEGLDVIKHCIRRIPDTKIIAMSNGDEYQYGNALSRAKELGAHALLEKPFTLDELHVTICDLIITPERNRMSEGLAI